MTTEADTPKPAKVPITRTFPFVTASREGLKIGDDLIIPGHLVSKYVGYEKKWRPEGAVAREVLHLRLYVSGFDDGGVAFVTEIDEEPWHPGMEGYVAPSEEEAKWV